MTISSDLALRELNNLNILPRLPLRTDMNLLSLTTQRTYVWRVTLKYDSAKFCTVYYEYIVSQKNMRRICIPLPAYLPAVILFWHI